MSGKAWKEDHLKAKIDDIEKRVFEKVSLSEEMQETNQKKKEG